MHSLPKGCAHATKGPVNASTVQQEMVVTKKKILYIVENQRDVLHASTVHKASGRRSHLRTLCAVQQENVVFCLRRCVQGDPVDNYLSGTGLLNAINKLIAPASILSIFIRTVVPLSVAQAQQLLRLINNESLVPHYR